EKAFYILPLCLMFTNWEIVRKIRSPEQETSYTTYSKILGPKIAICIALILQIIFNVTIFCIFHQLNAPLWLQVIYAVSQVFLLSLRKAIDTLKIIRIFPKRFTLDLQSFFKVTPGYL